MIKFLGLDPQSCIDMEFVWVLTPCPQESKCMPFLISQLFFNKTLLKPSPKKKHVFFLIVIRKTMTTQRNTNTTRLKKLS
jgi:hypothetical protein